MRDKIEIETLYPHPPERVWAALTDAASLSKWLLPADFKPLIGFRFRLDKPTGAKITGKVIEAAKESLLAYTWQDEDEGQPSKVVWTLTPEDGGTRVRLEQTQIEEPAVTCLAIDNYFNWAYALRHSLPGLLRILEGQERTPKSPVIYAEVGR